MSENKAITLNDLDGTVAMLDVMLGRFRQGLARTMTPEKMAALEADPPNECPNCNAVIGDHDSFCSEECEDAFLGDEAVELMVREGPVLDEDRLRDEEREREEEREVYLRNMDDCRSPGETQENDR